MAAVVAAAGGGGGFTFTPKDVATGNEVQVVTVRGERMDAVVFAYDRNAQLLALVCGSGSAKSYCMLPAHAIKSVTVVGRAAKDAGIPEVQAGNLGDLQKKEEKAVAARVKEAARIGVGVSRAAQAVFDALCKTWEGDVIAVDIDGIKVQPPYEPANCVGSSAQSLARVKKVLEAERKRLQL